MLVVTPILVKNTFVRLLLNYFNLNKYYCWLPCGSVLRSHLHAVHTFTKSEQTVETKRYPDNRGSFVVNLFFRPPAAHFR